MAKVYITEYASEPTGKLGQTLAMADEPAITTQTVAIGGSSVSSNAFNAKTKIVRVHTDAICSVLFGTGPTADANSPRLAAGSTEYFGVPINQAFKIAVITNT